MLGKVSHIVHKQWLAHGPSPSTVRIGNRMALTSVSDMGVEIGAGNTHDIVEEVIGRKDIPKAKMSKVRQFSISLTWPVANLISVYS